MPRTLKELNDRELLLVEYYLSNGRNGTQAALAAGYSEASAKQRAYQTLNKPRVRAYLEKRLSKAIITADEVLGELKIVGMGEYETYKSDKIKSLELLGKHLKIFTEKSEISVDLSSLTDDQLAALAEGKG